MTAPERPPGRRLRVLLIAAAATAVALAVGIPAGLAAAPDAAPPVAPSVVPTSPEPQTTVPPAPATTSPTEPAPTAPEPPSSLSAAQQRLWQDMEEEDLDAADCVGYPAGEQEFEGVVAALECPIEDSTMEQPAYLYQFDGASSLNAYLDRRAQGVDRAGQCADGDETDGYWTVDDRQIGRLVCVDNPKNGTVYFKIAFSFDADDAVVVVQDESPSDAYAWCKQHAAGQFYGVGAS